MSTHPLRCSTCDQECVYERPVPFGEQEVTFGVVWRCPVCAKVALDVCPVGPLVPAPELCLNCGERYPAAAAGEAVCRACGLSRQDCPASLGLGDAIEVDPVAAARSAFERGLFRRGLATLNQALQEGLDSAEAWCLKSRLLHTVGYNRAAAEMVGEALATVNDVADRVELLEEQAFLWAECQRGEDAYRSAEAARNLGSDSIRTHYLRGRSLALLGRLDEARQEIRQVLSRDPNNADAQRALPMLDAALRPWWQFWK